MTDKIDSVIAHIMASRAEAVVGAQRREADRVHDAEHRQAAAAEATQAWTDLKARIDTFLRSLNAKLEVAQIDVSFAAGLDRNAGPIPEYEAWFSRGSQSVDHNMRTVFKAQANGQIDIFIAAVGDLAPRATFEFRTEKMTDEDVAQVFAKFLEVGTRLPA
uniref:hypothetical protein n=1 Tax=Sphingomonas sp. TaxID=28214 RepID=UPI0025D85C33|nr:hypothetical protein [Sphingomonas sp.]